MSVRSRERGAFWPVLLAGCLFVSQVPVPNQSALAQAPAEAVKDGEVGKQMRDMRKEVRQLRGRVDLLINLLQKEHAANASEPAAAPAPSENVEPENSELDPVADAWNLSLRDAINIGLQNSKVIRNLGGVTPFGFRGDEKVRLARINTDISLEAFETSLRNLVQDVEATYWDTWQAHQQLNTAVSLRDSAQQQWKHIQSLSAGAETQDEAQAREQYFFARAQLEQAYFKLLHHEKRLRFLLGLASSDGRLIRPTDEPKVERHDVEDGGEIQKVIERLPEVRDQKQKIMELEKQTGSRNSRRVDREQSLRLDRERARLEDIQVNALHLLTSAIRQVHSGFLSVSTHFNRWQAASNEIESLTTLFEGGLTDIDLLLDARRRNAQAVNDYDLARARFAKARSDLLARQRRLLENHGLEIVDSSAEIGQPPK